MTREYARVRVTIWADADFRRLPWQAQALYLQLISSPTMNLCGVADWRPKRIAALTADITPADVEKAAGVLQERGYVVVDDDTEEILVRSFIRHDGLIKTPNIAAAMVKDYAGTASESLRGVVVHELHRLHDDDPGMKGWVVASKLLSEPTVDPMTIPSGMPSGNPSDTALPMGSNDASGNGSHIPHPASLNQHPSTPLSPEGGGRFEEFWSIYPSRGQHANPKKPAKAKWDLLIRRGEDPEAIIAGARRLAAYCKGKDPQHTPQATTWLNQERWKDEPAPEPPQAPDMNNWFLLK